MLRNYCWLWLLCLPMLISVSEPAAVLYGAHARSCGIERVSHIHHHPLFTSASSDHAAPAMASGVKVTDEVIEIFNDMKVRKAQTNEEEKKLRKKAVLFCLSKDLKNIVRDESNEILQGDLGVTVQDPFQHFIKMLPPDDCRYALYDATYETKETKKEDLVFMFWAPDSAPLKSKMIYASSKDAIKRKFEGIKHEWQVNGMEDLKDRKTLAEKLGGSSVVSLEGAPI